MKTGSKSTKTSAVSKKAQRQRLSLQKQIDKFLAKIKALQERLEAQPSFDDPPALDDSDAPPEAPPAPAQ